MVLVLLTFMTSSMASPPNPAWRAGLVTMGADWARPPRFTYWEL